MQLRDWQSMPRFRTGTMRVANLASCHPGLEAGVLRKRRHDECCEGNPHTAHDPTHLFDGKTAMNGGDADGASGRAGPLRPDVPGEVGAGAVEGAQEWGADDEDDGGVGKRAETVVPERRYEVEARIVFQ